MAFEINDGKSFIKKLFKNIGDSKGEFFLRYLTRRFVVVENKEPVFFFDVNDVINYLSRCVDIPYLICGNDQVIESVKSFISKYGKGYNEFSTDVHNDISPFKGSERECFICWFYIRGIDEGRAYEKLNLPPNPIGHKEMHVVLKEFFAFLDESVVYKKRLVSNVRKVCSESVPFKEPFSWCDSSDNEFVSWSWDYLSKRGVLATWMLPSFYSDRLKVLTASFFIWEAHVDTKKLFLKEMRSAWSQKKFRDGNQGNARLNTYIGKEAKKALSELVAMDGSSIKVVLEDLIVNEYKNRKGKIF